MILKPKFRKPEVDVGITRS